MTVLAIVSDNPGVGKTALCAVLARYVEDIGKKAVVYKPICTNQDSDVAIYQNLLGQDLNGVKTVDGSPAQSLSEIKTSATKLENENDLLIVEISSSINDEDSKTLVETLAAKVISVIGYRSDLKPSELVATGDIYSDKLVGLLVNGRTRYKDYQTQTELISETNKAGVCSLGVIPEDSRLLSVTVADIIEQLNGRIITETEETDRLVERFLVGGMGLDSGVDYFGLLDSKAVIVRGDRPDIQMAALQTPTDCLILTKGIEPIEYVLYEAEEQGVPIVMVDPDTIPTMELLATIQDRALFNHPDKLMRFGELLREHVDIGVIMSSVGLDIPE